MYKKPLIYLAIKAERLTVINSQLMLLLTRSQLPEFFLRNPHQEALKARKSLNPILTVQNLPLGPPNKLLNTEQARLVKMRPKTLVNLKQNNSSRNPPSHSYPPKPQ